MKFILTSIYFLFLSVGYSKEVVIDMLNKRDDGLKDGLQSRSPKLMLVILVNGCQ